MKASFSSKAKKKMERDAARGGWIGLIELPLIPAFAAWLSCRHGYLLQSPDTGEALVAYRDGITIRVLYDGRRTRCSRGVMALWHVFECFCLGRQI
ncbi:MAG TPA: hypothetical protein DEA67_00895 [Selenomonas sp.]|nr:hypothetical protein [Selenomonas sp.]